MHTKAFPVFGFSRGRRPHPIGFVHDISREPIGKILFFCAFLQNINKYISIAVPAVMEPVKQLFHRIIKRYHPDFPVFAPLCLYSDKAFFQVNPVPFQV
jgi:hypothetical protein